MGPLVELLTLVALMCVGRPAKEGIACCRASCKAVISSVEGVKLIEESD